MVVYYHYTTKSGAEAINKSKKINKSRQHDSVDDAALGDGCYFTNMDPDNYTKEQIAKDCWENVAQQALDAGKMDWVVKVYDLAPIEKSPYRKGVFIYRGDVNLQNVRHEITATPFSNDSSCIIF